MGFKGKALVFLAAALLAAVPVSAQKKEQRDSLVRLIKAEKLELMETNGRPYRRTVAATFLHNGTYLICDTAFWNVDQKIINAWGNVKVVQDETILTSEKMDYLVDDNLVQCRGGVVQLEDSDHNTLRTHHLDYNTKDSVAYFNHGASMRDKDGQIIESRDGSYDAGKGIFTFRGDVNMFTDTIFIKTTVLDYVNADSRADFLAPIDFWKDGNMLSASSGWYHRPSETFFFTGKVHGTTEEQEFWSDSLYYYRTPNDVLMLGSAQVQDTVREVSALANRIYYNDSLSRITLSDEAAVALLTREKEALHDSLGAEAGVREKVDTLYFGADTLIYYTIPRCDVAPGDSAAAVDRIAMMRVDPVAEYRAKAAKAAAEAAAKAEQEKAEREGRIAPGSRGRNNSKAPAAGNKAPAESAAPAGAPETPKSAAAPDSTALGGAVPDSLAAPVAATPDSLAVPADSASVPSPDAVALSEGLALSDSTPDSVSTPNPVPDTPEAPADSTAALDSTVLAPAPKDSTKIGFLDAKGNVKVYRHDIQISCDSLRYNDLDSIARLHIDPLVWNDGNRQYSSDSLFALISGNNVDRVSLQGNAFIITQEAPNLYDQIKAAEVMAYFDTTATLRRFDALGGATALFFLKERDQIATVNKVETKMISAWFKDSDLDRVHYFDSPKNDVYPLAQMKMSDRELKGFNWQPDLRPESKSDITALQVRSSERAEYAKRPKTAFPLTDVYFPGHMKNVYKSLAEAKARKKAASDAKAKEQEAAQSDTAAVVDSLAAAGEVQPVDSLAGTVGSVPADTLAAPAPVDSVQTPAPSAPLTQKQKRDSAEAARIAAREDRWARLDSLDAAKAAAKKAKVEARKQAKEQRLLERQRKQDLADEKKLQKYIERYRKRKAREDSRPAAARSKAAAKRASRSAEAEDTALPDPTRSEVEGSRAPERITPDKTTIINTNDNGTDSEQISEVHSSGHPE